jgi:hypothetical protein
MDYGSLDRKALQALAKQHGIKANQSNAKIVDELMAISATETTAVVAKPTNESQNERQSLLPVPPIESFVKEVIYDHNMDSAKKTNERLLTISMTSSQVASERTSALFKRVSSPAPAAVSLKRQASPASASRGKTPIKEPLSAKSPGTNDSYQFKPRPMPDFKRIHEKLVVSKPIDENKPLQPKPTTPTINKQTIHRHAVKSHPGTYCNL